MDTATVFTATVIIETPLKWASLQGDSRASFDLLIAELERRR